MKRYRHRKNGKTTEDTQGQYVKHSEVEQLLEDKDREIARLREMNKDFKLIKWNLDLKVEQLQTLTKELCEGVVFMWYHLETNTMTNNQLNELEVKYKKAQKYLDSLTK